MKDAKWDDEEAAKIYQEGLFERLSDDESMITVDESGFVNFQTKPQIALDLIHKIEQSGLFKSKWMDMDCLYGNNKGRSPHPKKRIATTPAELVSKIAGDDTIPWRKMCLGERSKGPIYSEIKCLRIYRAFAQEKGEVPIQSCWLFIRRSEDGQTRFSVSKAPEDSLDSELCKASLMRWPIHQCFNEAKDELGMDHYEFRSWTAWHRHMILDFIAKRLSP